MRRWVRHLLVFAAVVVGQCLGWGSCPGACSCKWKGGKQTVECRDKGLIGIPDQVDPETQVLDMSGNNLQVLPKDTFVRAGLLNLQKIFLSRCRLGQIDAQAFRGLTNLVELDLSDNLLTDVPSAAFRDTLFLRDLNLNSNPIQKIDAQAFEMVPGLVRLDLSDCRLEAVSAKAFENLKLLEVLRLNGNRLSELRPKTVTTLSQLHEVVVHDNPWHCDCRLRAMKEWLTKHNIPHPVSPACNAPARLARRTFEELDVDDFACKPEVLPSARFVESGRGDNATLVCRVRAVPAAEVRWYRHGRQLANNSLVNLGSQRVLIFEEGSFDKSSALVLTNSQDDDSGDLYCVAENGAGLVESNFTLLVAPRAAGVAALGSGQIAGLSAAFILLFIIVLAVAVLFLARLRRLPFLTAKDPASSSQDLPPTVIPVNHQQAAEKHLHPSSDAPTLSPNPVQKPPRLTDIAYTTSHYDGDGSVVAVTSPTRPLVNNPDLVHEAESRANGRLPNGSCLPERAPSQGRSPDAGRSLPADPFQPHDLSAETAVPAAGSMLVYGSCTLPRRFCPGTTSPFPPDYGLPLPPSAKDDSVLGGSLKRRPGPSSFLLGEGPATSSSSSSAYNTSSESTPKSGKGGRFWMKGPPLLPPHQALNRITARDSPDEGYQEGYCGTDV